MRRVPWLDREYVKWAADEMRLRGMTAKDSVFAASVGSTMLALDHVCMPGGAPRGAVDYMLGWHNRIMARCHRDPAKRERYEIIVVGFADRMVNECRGRQLFSGREYDLCTMTTVIAAHEVRHRLQPRTVIRKFTPFCHPGSDVLLRGIVAGVSAVFKARREELEKTVRGGNEIRVLWSDDEFDAQVIERVVMHHAPLCTTIEELAHLVLYEPTL